MSGKIYAPLKTAGLVNDPNDPTNTYGDITGSDVGNKRALDVTTFASNYATIVDEASSTVTYIGKAAIASASSAAVWQVFKMTVSGTETIITWADGDSSFNNVWDDRASLVYS